MAEASTGSFHSLCQFEQLDDAIPVSSGAGCLQRLHNRRPGYFRTRHAIGKISVELASLQPPFLLIGLDV